MKKILLAALVVFCSSAFGLTKLKGYSEACDAIDQGELITFVVQFDKCEFDKDSAKMANLKEKAIFRPNGFVQHPDGYLKTRGLTFSSDIASAPKLKNVNQSYTYIFNKDNELRITNLFLDPKTYKEKSKPFKLICKLGEGFEVFA